MKLNLSKIIFLFILLFAFDISADKKIPLLAKDLYLNGTDLFLNAGRNNYSIYDLLIHIYNDYDKKTRDLVQRCEERYQEYLESYGKKERADSVMSKFYPECMQDYEKSEVLSDVYVYVIDQNINRNEYKKLTECETYYDGDGNEFIKIREWSCENYNERDGSVGLDNVFIQRNNLLTTLKISYKNDIKIEMKFLSEEEYRETYQQLDEKHQAYVKEINEKSLL